MMRESSEPNNEQKEKQMQEPGLDNRHRDKNGEIERKRSDAVNKNLPNPIREFSPNATVKYMRQATGKVGLNAIRRAAKNR
jgi:hypothetical protein